MTVLFTLSQTTVPAGPRVLGPASVAPAVKQYVLKLLQAAWPGADDLAFTYSCDVSQDNGSTWTASSVGDVYDSPIPASGPNPANQILIICDLPGVGSSTRRVRFSSNFAKALTVSGTLEAN